MNKCPHSPPTPGGDAGRVALQALLRERSMMAPLRVFHRMLGNIFRITVPGFRPVMMAGPEANRFVLVEARDQLSWRPEGDPVVDLLRHGVLIEDGEWHDRLRGQMTPALHKKRMAGYVESMWRRTDQVVDGWHGSGPHDMLDEMRKVALLILMETLYKVDFTPELERLWPAILKLLQYISPGFWLLWRGVPRPGYTEAIQMMDDYLYRIIRERRADPGETDDLLGLLVASDWMSDGLIRDQLLTMFIAGHDTSTALLAWALYLLGKHPEAMARARAEVDAVLGRADPTYETVEQLDYLDRVIKETLRLYPPIHLGTRRATADLTFDGYGIPAGDRVVYSIYLTHRDPKQWQEPHRFDPERFLVTRGQRTYEPYAYVPFGGGPRNCIGAVYGQVEAKVVLARLLQTVELTLADVPVHEHMGATLEPRPGVMMSVKERD